MVQPTEASNSGELVDEIVSAVGSCAPPAAMRGGGVPSVVEFATGRVRSSVNLHMDDLDLHGVLAERLDLPVFVDNDATVAALGEAFDDAGRAIVQNLVMFTVGPGSAEGSCSGAASTVAPRARPESSGTR